MKFKAKVYVRLRAAVDDSAGNAVRQACGRLSDLDIEKLRLGKLIEIDFDAEDQKYAEKEIDRLSDRLFANGVIEDYVYALMWWYISSSNGNENAKEYIEEFEEMMTKSQIKEAKRLSKECIKKDFKGC